MMVSLTVQAFDVESACYCQYDWVTVFNNAGQEMHTWCGADANGKHAGLDEVLSRDIWGLIYSVIATSYVLHCLLFQD